MATYMDLILVLLSAACFASSLGLSNSDKNSDSSGFGMGLTPNNLQSWQDWKRKRNLGQWNQGDFGNTNFQQWQDWMAKRGFGHPDFGSMDKTMFQEWRDWVNKRGLGSQMSFPSSGDSGHAQFQQWNDWMAKRGFHGQSDVFGTGLGELGQLQSWDDFVKRQQFMYPGASLDGLSKANFQSWQDWAKRMMPHEDPFLGHYKFGSNDNFMRWQDFHKKSADKRQLGYGPVGLGHFRRYFTNGLQDWRSTYKGTKRSKGDEQQEKEKQ